MFGVAWSISHLNRLKLEQTEMKKMMRRKLKMEKLLEPFMKEKYPDREAVAKER